MFLDVELGSSLHAGRYAPMAPKRNGKRKDSDPGTTATEPGAGDGASANSRAPVPLPSPETLPDMDAAILAEVRLLGHYPGSLNAGSQDTATNDRKAEETLYQQIKR